MQGRASNYLVKLEHLTIQFSSFDKPSYNFALGSKYGLFRGPWLTLTKIITHASLQFLDGPSVTQTQSI